MASEQTQKTVAEYFAGIGLVRLGLEKSGWKVVFANDISEEKKALYDGHFADAVSHFVCDDIHKIDASKIPAATLATASFPCTDLSLAGMRMGLSGKQSSAYWGFIRVLEALGPRRPKLVMLENVVGFMTSKGGKDFQSALLALNELGYEVDALIIDAARFVPQSRVRLFVIGSLPSKPYCEIVRETPVFYEGPLRPRALAEFIYSHPEISWHIRTTPEPPIKSEKTLKDIIEPVPHDSSIWWNEKRTNYLLSQMSVKHAAALKAMMGQRKWSYGTAFRRVRNGKSQAELRTDGIAGCLRTPKGGSAKQILIQAGFNQVKVRLLTARECARLMGADEFSLKEVALDKALYGFGDAVCVPVINWIADNYLNPLAHEIASKESS
jgi:DNA (cytosine-5)-methyltransferase 1